MNYIAIFLDETGKALSNDSSEQYINIQLGDFKDINQATNSARLLFDGDEIEQGVLWSRTGCGGMLITSEVNNIN
ncbi:hypothetical protein RJ45_17030 [Photobacterium gaetbulicola]|uniref:Uncharacterized protein n=1 Tax=Photobacterium gaetbulicola TaxID=1295392 RepID=A0A0B9GC88_9GAMM|nr:hypothetical protein [Photobacterium gaetbulicola]KHT62520.1 hypothetical protein RJ45_17030 [Photobacterium gaetbulicola]